MSSQSQIFHRSFSPPKFTSDKTLPAKLTSSVTTEQAQSTRSIDSSTSPSLTRPHSSSQSSDHGTLRTPPGPLSAPPNSTAPNAPNAEGALSELRTLLETMDEECAAALVQEFHLFKKKRQKARVIAEILSTEESYMQQLNLLETIFMQPLGGILPPKTCEVLFTNVRSIKQMNHEFLQDLKDKNKSLGSVFLAFAPFLQIYHGYAKGTAKAHRLVTQLLATNAKFAEFHAKAVEEAKGMNLNSYLITPIQRVPRYKLLLTEVLKYSDESHPDTAQLKVALEEISKAAQLINEAVRKEEFREGLKELEDRFTSKLTLDAPNREFFFEGLLTKVCRRDSKPFLFFLFSDLLVYGVENKAINKVRVSKVIPIDSHFSVKALDNEEQSKQGKPLWSWQIISTTKSFVCFAANEEEFNKWFLKLKELTASNQSTGEVAPVWTSDKEAMDCAICKSKFTITNRRHHCRQCGTLVCGACSPNRLELAMEQGVKVRVCDPCFLKSKEVKEQETVAEGCMQGKKKDPEAIFEGSLLIKAKGNDTLKSGSQKNASVYCVVKLSSFSWYKNEDAPKPMSVIELEGATVSKDFEGADGKDAFSFQINAQGKTTCLLCESKLIRDKWVSAISDRKKMANMVPKKDSASIREGYLFKQGGKVANWKYRYVVLGTQDLCYYKNVLDIKPAGTVLLAKGVALQEEASVKGKVCLFSITPSGSARKWMFSCKTDQERTEWVDAIRQRGASPHNTHGTMAQLLPPPGGH